MTSARFGSDFTVPAWWMAPGPCSLQSLSVRGHEVYGSTPISYQPLRRGMLKVFQEVGLPKEKFGTHSMRSGGATLAANSGVRDSLWMKHRGWKSYKSAVGYVETSSEAKASVTNAIFCRT